MQNRSCQEYYRLGEGSGEIESSAVPLSVNCCGEAVITEGKRYGYSRGRRDHYLIYMTEGKMCLRLGDRTYDMKCGEVVCVSPRTPCVYFCEHGSAAYIWVHFTGSEAAKELSEASAQDRICTPHDDGELLRHLQALFDEFLYRRQDFEYATALELRYILHLVARSVERGEGRLERSLRYIHSHLEKPLCIADLAAMEYLGVSRYRELFRELTGRSPRDYITDLRIARARSLLSMEGGSIAEVAEQVGFTDRLYFQRVFRKHTGATPGEYKRRHRPLEVTENE